MKTSKRLLSFFLAVVMVVTSCSVGLTAFAAEKNGSIWSTNVDADAAYDSLEALVDEFLPGALMGIEAVSNGVYAIYAEKMGKLPADLTDAEKAEIAGKATTQDVIAALSPVIFGALTGTSQQAFADSMEGDGANASHYDYLQGMKGSTDFFTLYTICRDYKDNSELSSDSRKTLKDWYEKLSPLANKYLEEAGKAEEALGEFNAIIDGIIEKLAEAFGCNPYDGLYEYTYYEISKNVDDILSKYPLSAEEQALVTTYLKFYSDYMVGIGATVELNSIADFIYYYGGDQYSGGLGKDLGTASVYHKLINDSGSKVTLKGSYDLGFGTIKVNITEDISVENYETLFTQAYLADTNLSENAFYAKVIGKTEDEINNNAELKEFAKSFASLRYISFYTGMFVGADGEYMTSSYYRDYVIGFAIKSGVYANRAEVDAAAAKRMPKEIPGDDILDMATALFGIKYMTKNRVEYFSPEGNGGDYPYYTQYYDNSVPAWSQLPESLRDTAFADYMKLVFKEGPGNEYVDGFLNSLYGPDAALMVDSEGKYVRDGNNRVQIANYKFDEDAFKKYVDDAYTFAYTQVAYEALQSIGYTTSLEMNRVTGVDYSLINVTNVCDAFFATEPELPVNIVLTEEEQKVFNANYNLAGQLGVDIVNLTINNAVVGIISDPMVSNFINGLVDSDVDLVVALNDLWARLYDAPVATVFELLPILMVLLDEFVLPLVFNTPEDQVYNAVWDLGQGGLIGGALQLLGLDISFHDLTLEYGSYIGISQIGWDLNTLLPELMAWLLASKEAQDNADVAGVDFYKAQEVVLQTPKRNANGDEELDSTQNRIPVPVVYTENNFGKIDFQHYTVKDSQNNVLTQNEDGTLTYKGQTYADAEALFEADEDASFKCYMTYSDKVPNITGIYFVDQFLENANISDLEAMITAATGDATLGTVLYELIKEVAVFFRASVDEFVNTPEYRNEKRYHNSVTDDKPTMSGLNNILVALPRLFDIMENLAAEKYGVDANLFEYCFEGRIDTKEIKSDGKTYTSTFNSYAEQFKSYAGSNKADRAVDILDCFAEVFVESWLNGIISVVNAYFSGDNKITNNIPIISGLLNAFGGFGENSIFTDILNSVFQLNRESDYSFSFTQEHSNENNKLTGLSKDNAYFLITNIPRLVEVIKNLSAHFNTGNGTATANASVLSSVAEAEAAASSNSPLYDYANTAKSKAGKAVASYSSNDLSTTRNLIDNLDKMLSSLLSDSSLNGFSLDTSENIIAGIVSLLDKFLGADINVGNDTVTKIVVLVNKYLYYITGESENMTPSNGNADPKKIYTNNALTGLVVETYALIEDIATQLLEGYTDSYDGNDELTYNLLEEAIHGVISPDAVGVRLTSTDEHDYSDAQKKIMSYANWTDLAEASSRNGFTKLRIDWDFKDGDKEGFYDGFSASLRMITTVLGVLFVETQWYDTVIEPIYGAMAYRNDVEVTPYEELVADYNKTGYYDKTLIAMIAPVTGWLDALLRAPATTLIQTMQGFAGIADESNRDAGTISSILVGIIKPIAKEIKGIGNIFSLKTDKLGALSPTLGNLLTKLEIDLGGTKLSIMEIIDAVSVILPNVNINTVINMVLQLLDDRLGIKIELNLIDFKYLNETTKEKAFVYVVEYVLDILLNENFLNLLALLINDDVVKEIIDAILENEITSKDLFEIVDQILSITESPTLAYWTFAQYLQELTQNFRYPLGITKSMADNGVAGLDNIIAKVFPLLASFGVDLGGENLNDILNSKLFTNGLLTQMATGIYGALENALKGVDPMISSALKGIGFVYTTKDVAKLLTDKSYGATYSSAAKAISAQSDWSKVKNVNWGFADGSSKAHQGFVNALAAILRPFNTVLTVFLGEGSLELNKVVYSLIDSLSIPETTIETVVAEGFGFKLTYGMKNGVLTLKIDDPTRERSAVSTLKLDLTSLKNLTDLKIVGTNGYNSAIIPLLEVFQCSDIKTYSQYQKDIDKAKDNILLDVLNPLIGSAKNSFLNRVAAAPLAEITKLLPNLAMYLDANGLSQLVNNLLAPVTQFVSKISSVIDIQGLIEEQLLGGQTLGNMVADLLGVNVKIDLDLKDLSKLNVKDLIVPVIRMVLANQGNAALKNLKIYDINWDILIGLGSKTTYTSHATGADGNYLEGKLVTNVDQGKVLITVLRYVAKTLIANMGTIQTLVLGIEQLKNNDMLKSIFSSVFNTIGMSSADQLVAAIFYLLASEPTNAFWDYTGYKTAANTFKYPGSVDEDFLKTLPAMLDGLIGGLADLNKLVTDAIFKDEIITSLAKGLYGAIDGVKINDQMNLTQLLAQTGIDFSTSNVASLLVDKSYGQTFAGASEAIKAAGSWSKVSDSIKWGVKDRDSFMHALVAVLRPLYGVLDVILNDASLGLFDIVYIPGSSGYTSTVVPLMEAFSLYNIKTQYQYRQDINKEYDAILLDIINPIWDLVEDLLAAPLQTLTKILPNLALFIGNNGLVQVIDNLLTPVSALIDALRPIVDLNSVLDTVLKSLNVDLGKYLSMVGITNFQLDLYDLNKTLKPVLGADALIPLVNSVIGLIDINGTKINVKLNDVDWLKLASHGKTIVGASQAASYGSRIYVEGDSSETLIAVLSYLIETINAGSNYDSINSLIGGLLGGADETIANIVPQVMGALKGDTDEVIANLVDLLQTLAG